MKRIAMAVMVVGCATPYQAKGFRGGYSDSQLGSGRYSVDVQVNSYTSAGTALEYAYRRAGELCESGFDVIDGSRSQRDYITVNNGVAQNNPKSQVSLIVECKETVEVVSKSAEPPADDTPSPPHDTERAILTGVQPVYCTVSTTDAGVGLCFVQSAACDAEHARQGAPSTECTKRSNSACFNAKQVIDDERVTVCSPTVKDCEKRLAAYRDDADFAVTQPMCAIYRSGTDE